MIGDVFGLAVDCGRQKWDADYLAKHFAGFVFPLPGGEGASVSVRVERAEGDRWWRLVVTPDDVSEDDPARRRGEAGWWLYQRLRRGPSFRAAIVGDERRWRLLHTLGGEAPAVDGLVLRADLWERLGEPAGFQQFTDEHVWRIYYGEWPDEAAPAAQECEGVGSGEGIG